METSYPVNVIKKVMICDECEKGEMERKNKASLDVSNMGILHKCTFCHDEKHFDRLYPQIIYQKI